jgi:hypothetical protein
MERREKGEGKTKDEGHEGAASCGAAAWGRGKSRVGREGGGGRKREGKEEEV